MEKNNRVLLASFYQPKSIALRYLEHALEAAGFEVWVVAFKKLSHVPQNPTETELQHFLSLIKKHDPLFVGFSLPSSFYLEIVINLSELVKSQTSTSLVWGGIYPTLHAKRCLRHCDYVIRGEAEEAVVEFASKLRDKESIREVENLSFLEDGEVVSNPVRKLEPELDNLKMAQVGKQNKYYIESNKLLHTDFVQSSHNYETSCSRGCPYACSYCTSNGLKQLYKGSKYVRFRSVANVIDELRDAKKRMKLLSTVYFYDEIFSVDPNWIDEFCARYKAEIGLPFGIWGHPTWINFELISKLRRAGLYYVSMGVQSGSPNVRRNAFKRAGTNDQILTAATALVKANVPWVRYEFICRHPYEHLEDVIETYELCAKIPGKFSLRIFDLRYLPGTEIAKMAVQDRFYTEEEMEKLMYAPMDEQYAGWFGKSTSNDAIDFWINLTYLTQYKFMKGMANRLAKKGANERTIKQARRYNRLCKKTETLQNYWTKIRMFLRGIFK